MGSALSLVKGERKRIRGPIGGANCLAYLNLSIGAAALPC